MKTSCCRAFCNVTLFTLNKLYTEIVKVKQQIEMNKTSPSKIMFWINESRNYTKSVGKDVVDIKVFILEHWR